MVAWDKSCKKVKEHNYVLFIFCFYVFNDVYAGEGVCTWVQALEALDAPGECIIGHSIWVPGRELGPLHKQGMFSITETAL